MHSLCLQTQPTNRNITACQVVWDALHSGNGFSRIWKRLRMWPTKKSLMNLTFCVGGQKPYNATLGSGGPSKPAGQNNPYIGSLEAWLQSSNKEQVYKLVRPPRPSPGWSSWLAVASLTPTTPCHCTCVVYAYCPPLPPHRHCPPKWWMFCSLT